MQAAADSPFLDNLLSSASGVLCVLSLPERVMSHKLDMSTGALNDPEKYAIRAAVQVGRTCSSACSAERMGVCAGAGGGTSVQSSHASRTSLQQLPVPCTPSIMGP